jgi:DNA polymerase-3 subunit gamma/tau
MNSPDSTLPDSTLPDSTLPDSTLPSPTTQTGSRYVVVARRYRPKSFGQLIGQDQVSQALLNAVNSGRVGHAYLFTGARGVGKTSSARIFAKALNCPQATEQGAPDDCECDICGSIDAGDDIDVLEIDGASNRGIDEIRQLRANVNVRPSRAKNKIYIIDEVHMLTSQAFNALLKTLEEPPGHVKFIFCTTDPEKIPITVLSRCQRFDFAPIPADSILQRLKEIVESEGRTAEDAALELLARRAGGSMRDSQSLLEQLLSFAGEKIVESDVHTMLGTAPGGRVRDISLAMMDRDGATTLAMIDQAVSEGVEVTQLADQLLGFLRDVMAAAVGCSAELLIHSPGTSPQELTSQAESWGIETVLAAAQIMDQAIVRMRQSAHPRTLLEIAAVRVIQLEKMGDLADLIGILEAGGPLPTASPSPGNATKAQAAARSDKGGAGSDATPTTAKVKPAAAQSSAENSQKKTAEVTNEPSPPQLSQGEADGEASITTNSQAEKLWSQVLSSIEDITSEYAARASSVAISAPNRLVVTFPKSYTWHKEKCDSPDRRSKIEHAARQLAGGFVGFEFRIDQSHETTAKAVRARPSAASRVQAIREVERDPFIQEVMDMFDAEILKLTPARVKSS